MSKIKFPIVVEKEDNMYVAHCPAVGVTSQGKTFEETKNNLKEAIELYLEFADADEKQYFKKFVDKEQILATITV